MNALAATCQGLSRGFLPLAALSDLGPTAVAYVDLDVSLEPFAPDGRPLSADDRDCLLLIRLHDDPLAVVHLEANPAAMASPRLAEAILRLTGEEIRHHVQRFGCRHESPKEPSDLLPSLQAEGGGCRGATAAGETASAAVILSTTGGDRGQLKRCLISLLAQRRGNSEVVVIDNRPSRGETRGVVEEVSADEQRVRYVAEPRAGLSIARNRGLTETEADLVAFTDDDVVVDPLWLQWLLDPFSDASVTVACGMVLPLELETEAQKRFERYLGFSRGVEERQHDLQTGRNAGVPVYPFLADVFGSGNSMAFRRQELLRSGGFDPALGAGSPTHAGEETDAFSRAILRGGRIVYQPRALSWHQHRRDGEALRHQIYGYGVGVGALVTKAVAHDRRFYRAAAAEVIPLLRGLVAPSAIGRERWGSAAPDDSSGELLRARRAGIAQGPFRYLQGVVRAHRLGLWQMNPAHDGKATDGAR